jgi:hypothetical protein
MIQTVQTVQDECMAQTGEREMFPNSNSSQLQMATLEWGREE